MFEGDKYVHITIFTQPFVRLGHFAVAYKPHLRVNVHRATYVSLLKNKYTINNVLVVLKHWKNLLFGARLLSF